RTFCGESLWYLNTAFSCPWLSTARPSSRGVIRQGASVGAVPEQAPAEHTSVSEHEFPSLQLVPSAFGTVAVQTPVAGTHVPLVWHWSATAHVTGFAPWHTPV